jgi:putative two-component system hydrogenase maturation factor HypX/HoxX
MRAARKLEEVLRRGPNPLRGEQPVKPADQPLRILFLVSAHNSLSQRAEVALTEIGHEVIVAVVGSAAEMEAAVAQAEPELIVCPILKKIIPESIFSEHRCLIVHPGPRGDKGASSLDWAITLGAEEWGVTVLEATADGPRATSRSATRARAASTATRSAAARSRVCSRRSASWSWASGLSRSTPPTRA